jgi:hypothetical protein
LLVGKPDGKTQVTVGMVDGSGQAGARFEMTQQGSRIEIEGSGLAGFTLQLPWAKAVSDLDGAEVGAPPKAQRPGDTAGVWLQVRGERVAFSWS